MSNVIGLPGVLTGEREVNQIALKEAEALVEAINAGEVVGVAIVKLHYDAAHPIVTGKQIGRAHV